MFNKKTEPIRLTVKTETLPRLVRHLQHDSMQYLWSVPLNVDAHMGSDDRVDVVLQGWQVDKLMDRLPKRTLEEEYP